MKETIKITCGGQKFVPLSELKNFQGNLKELGRESFEKLRRQILSKKGFSFPVFVWGDNNLLDGHQRLFVLQHLVKKGYSIGPIPVVEIEAANKKEAAEKLLALNSHYGKITDQGLFDFINDNDLDFDTLVDDLDLPDFDIDVFVNEFEGGGEGEAEGDNQYTKKITAPVYEPKNEKPPITELFDSEKSDKFEKKIRGSKIPEAEKKFLIAAAKRHVVFNYQKIADYYAHSNKDVQGMMEESALVIIDFDKAIENGYVKLSEEIAGQYLEDYPDDA